jgi:hypothetical protein
MDKELALTRKIQKQRYLEYKNKQKKDEYSDVLKIFNLSPSVISNIINEEYIEKIQRFYKKYKLSDKDCINIEYLFDCDPQDIIKIRINNQVYGYHYLVWEKHFDIRGYSDIKTDMPINLFTLRRINKNIRDKTKFKYEKMINFQDFKGIYNGNYSNGWEFNDMFNILEDRGIQKISVPQSMFTKMLSFDPNVYALELITNDSVNINKSFCMFNDFPMQDNDDENILSLPLGVYNQLKISPNHNEFKMRIIKPDIGQRIKLKCFINTQDSFEDIKNQLTIELTKHKIISLNQIIAVESDMNHSIIPFLVTECIPSNIINITNIDLEIDFDECFNYENPIESLFMYFNT